MSSTYTPKELNRGAPQPSPSSSISASAAAHHRRFLRRCSLSVLSEHLHDLLYEPSLYSPFFLPPAHVAPSKRGRRWRAATARRRCLFSSVSSVKNRQRWNLLQKSP
jgi:hypothetical protein